MEQSGPGEKRRTRQDQAKSGKIAPEEAKPAVVAILAVPLAHASAVYGGFDILSTAGLRFDVQTGCVNGARQIRPIIVGPTRETVSGWNGVGICPTHAIAEATAVDAVFIPSVGEPDQPLPEFDPGTLNWLRDQYAGGAVMTAACSGTWLLAAAGLLEGERATTHWAYAKLFQRVHPQVKLNARQSLVLAGRENRIITAGGGSLWTELVLYLISRLVDQEAAVQTSKLYLIDWARDDQLPYALLTQRTQHRDGTIKRAQQLIEDRLAEEQVLTRVREEIALSDRSFERRFKAATGVSPLKYLQQLRIEAAKQCLERTRDPVESIAFQIGYADPTSFRRLFSRFVGVTPSEYRRRLGPKWLND